jgi:hypothetical protein
MAQGQSEDAGTPQNSKRVPRPIRALYFATAVLFSRRAKAGWVLYIATATWLRSGDISISWCAPYLNRWSWFHSIRQRLTIRLAGLGTLSAHFAYCRPIADWSWQRRKGKTRPRSVAVVTRAVATRAVSASRDTRDKKLSVNTSPNSIRRPTALSTNQNGPCRSRSTVSLPSAWSACPAYLMFKKLKHLLSVSYSNLAKLSAR